MKNPPTLFTTIKIEEGQPQLLDEHIRKLQKDYQVLFQKELKIPMKQILENLKEAEYQSDIWRLNLFAGSSFSYKIRKEPSFQKEHFSLKIYPKPFYEELPQYKKENFSKRKELLLEAQSKGFDDYLFVDEKGHFLETCICNLFWIKGKIIYTPSHKLPLYFGVTLQNILRIGKKWGFQIQEVFEKDIQTLTNSHLFVCNSMKGALPVKLLGSLELKIDLDLFKDFKRAYFPLNAL